MEDKEFKKEMEWRREIRKAQESMFCPLTNRNCKTMECMWYDDEPQECAVTNFSKSISVLAEIAEEANIGGEIDGLR